MNRHFCYSPHLPSHPSTGRGRKSPYGYPLFSWFNVFEDFLPHAVQSLEISLGDCNLWSFRILKHLINRDVLRECYVFEDWQIYKAMAWQNPKFS